jgi:hypothetical protein
MVYEPPAPKNSDGDGEPEHNDRMIVTGHEVSASSHHRWLDRQSTAETGMGG